MLTQTELVLPEAANHYGTLFAPTGLALLGKMAFLVATRFTRQTYVMASATNIEFLKPAPIGSLLQFTARVTRVGRCSLTANVVATFDVAPGQKADEVLRGDFELVAVDAHGKPCAIVANAEAAPTSPPSSIPSKS
ncbi:MAG: acyl-CoA thioesterase [Rhizobacter sp.]